MFNVNISKSQISSCCLPEQRLLTFWPCYHIPLLKHLPLCLFSVPHSLQVSPLLSYLDLLFFLHVQPAPWYRLWKITKGMGSLWENWNMIAQRDPGYALCRNTILQWRLKGSGCCLTSYTKLVQELKLESRSSVHLLSATPSTLPAFLTSNIPITPRLE